MITTLDKMPLLVQTIILDSLKEFKGVIINPKSIDVGVGYNDRGDIELVEFDLEFECRLINGTYTNKSVTYE